MKIISISIKFNTIIKIFKSTNNTETQCDNETNSESNNNTNNSTNI